MIQDDPIVLDAFSKEFNSRFNTLDFRDNTNKLMDILNKKSNINIKHSLFLPCENDINFKYLVDFRYENLINQIIKRVKIEEETIDNYLSEMDCELVQVYSDCLLAMVKVTTIEINETKKSFEIKCPELFLELLWSPISQFHSQVLIELEHLDRIVTINRYYMEMTSDKPVNSNLFINSKTSTAYAYFILAFIAENLNIPLKI